MQRDFSSFVHYEHFDVLVFIIFLSHLQSDFSQTGHGIEITVLLVKLVKNIIDKDITYICVHKLRQRSNCCNVAIKILLKACLRNL